MNMKKLMAVVLAVVLAISAMAVTAFAGEAETYTIDLFTDRANTNQRKVTYTFDVPVYAMFGYADQAHYLEITTANAFSDAASSIGIKWYIEVNGRKFEMKSVKTEGFISEKDTPNIPDPNKSTTQYVNFGFFGHHYYNDTLWTTVPQSTAVNQYTSMKLIAEVTTKNVGWDNTAGTGDFSWGGKQEAVKIQLCKADDNGNKDYSKPLYVVGSTVYARSMTVTKNDSAVNFSYNKFKVINNTYTFANDWSADLVKDPATSELVVDTNEYVLTWDHTLMNKSRILNATSAKLVVELASNLSWEGAGSTTGSALYSLWMGDAKVTPEMFGENNNSLWWNNDAYNRAKGWVATCTVNGTVSTLEFDVPVEMLYNGTYGYGNSAAVYNGGFKIYKQFEADASAFQNNKLNGQNIIYRNQAVKAYLVLTMPVEDNGDIDTVTPEDPVEPGNTDEEPEEPGDVSVTEPKDEDKNPPTGIVLAVLPMVVAAAAVVASKRR